MDRGMDHLSYEDRLRVGVVQPGEEKAAGRPSYGLQYVKGANRKAEENLFSKACCDKSRP